MRKRRSSSTPLLRFAFVVYTAILLWLLFGRSSGWTAEQDYRELLKANMNLVPFHTIGNYWRVVCRREFTPLFYHCIVNLVGKIFLFIPIGYFLPRLWLSQRNFLVFLLTCILSITLVEVLQLVTLLGSLDIDDLILNLFGMLLGYLIFIFSRNRGKL